MARAPDTAHIRVVRFLHKMTPAHGGATLVKPQDRASSLLHEEHGGGACPIASSISGPPHSDSPSSSNRPSLNLSASELVEACGGYARPADQLRALHNRGFVRAFRRMNGKGPVILERAHYDAVVRGEFGPRPAANDPGERKPIPPNRVGVRKATPKK